MPTLPTPFTAELGGGQISGGRRAVAEDFGTGADLGKGIRAAATAYVAEAEDTESRKALVSTTEIRAKYAKALDEAALSGADLGKLKESMDTEIAKVGEGFETRRGAQSLQLYAANTGLMFDEQANAIQVRRAFANAKLEGSKFLNGASSIIQSNPAYLDIASKDAEALAGTFTGVRPEQRAEIADGLKKELNMAAAIGSARIDPEGTKKKLEGGEWDLTPEQRNTALNKAETEMRAKRADESYQRALKEHNEREADEKSRDTHFKGIIDGTTSRRAIMDDPSLRPQTREHLIVFMEERAKALTTQEKRSDPIALRNLWMRINAPDGDPSKVYNGDAIFEAVKAGEVNTSDANMLNTLVANQRDENGRTIGSKLGALMGTIGRAVSQDPQFTGQPALVAEIQMDYQSRVYDKLEALRKGGKDPNAVFDQTSKEYVGSREFIQGSIDAARLKQRANAPQVARPKDKTEYDAMPAGTPYIDPQGNPGVKPKGGRTSSGKITGGAGSEIDTIRAELRQNNLPPARRLELETRYDSLFDELTRSGGGVR